MSQPLSLDDIDRLRLLGQSRLRPDGGAVVYLEASFDLDADRTVTRLCVVDSGGGEPRDLTEGPADWDPQWSPDGLSVAFLRAGELPWRRDLHVVEVATGEVRRVAVLPRGVDAFRWSPDGTGFALLGAPDFPGPGASPEERRQAYSHRVVQISRLGHLGYSGLLDDERSQVWWCPLDGEPRQLTDIAAGVTAPRFAPDGRITFGAAVDDDYDLHPLQDLWAVDRNGGTPERLATGLNQLRGHQVLPDGRVLHVGMAGREWHYGAVIPRLFVDGDDVTGILDRPVGRATEVQSFTLDYLSDVEPPIVEPDGGVWFNVVDRGCCHLYRLDTDDKPQPVLTGRRLIGDFSVAGGRIAWIETSPDGLQNLRIAAVDGSDERVLVDPNPWVADRTLGEIRTLPVQVGGFEMDAWAVLPAGWDGTPLPAIVDIHPGPHSSWPWDFKLEHRLIAEQGYAVLSCNHPGSAGYGAAFAELLRGNWGYAELPAYEALADAGVAAGLAVAGRIGVSGITSGAYAALWALAHSDRFAAGVVNRAISDMWSEYNEGDIGYWYGPAVLGAEPWEDEELYHRMSPAAHAHRITAPVRFIAFEGNTRTPLAQSEAVFIRLRKRGIPTDILVYPAGTATVFMPGSPSLRKHMLTKTLEWWDRYLAGGNAS